MDADRAAVLDRALDKLAVRGIGFDVENIPYCPYRPWPKQAAFLSPTVTAIEEVFYGGAVGGAKSVALLMAALQYVDHPGYKAVLVRKTFSMLNQPDSLIPMSKKWMLGQGPTYNESKHEWTFPSGAVIVFRHLEDNAALADYQSASYHYIGIDEVTDLTLAQYVFVYGRARRVIGDPIPIRIRSASNPIGTGRDWVYTRFVLPGAQEGKLFIPARLEDNAAYDPVEYDRRLRELDPVLYQQLRWGDWTIKPTGGMFHRDWFPIVSASDVPAGCTRVRRWDLAATEVPKGREARRANDPDYTVGVLLARAPDGTYFVEDVVRERLSSAGVEELVAETAYRDGVDVVVRMEQEPGSSGKAQISHYRRRVLDGYTFRGVPSTGDKATRAAPVAARAEQGEVSLVEGPWIDAFLDELAGFSPTALHDDQVDALSGAYFDLAGRGSRGVKPVSFTAGSHWTNA